MGSNLSYQNADLHHIFDAREGLRLFGFLGAGATLGQLVGSLFSGLLSGLSRDFRTGAPVSAVKLQLSAMFLAAVLLEVAGRLAGQLKRPHNAIDDVGVRVEAGLKQNVRFDWRLLFTDSDSTFIVQATAEGFTCPPGVYIFCKGMRGKILLYVKSCVHDYGSYEEAKRPACAIHMVCTVQFPPLLTKSPHLCCNIFLASAGAGYFETHFSEPDAAGYRRLPPGGSLAVPETHMRFYYSSVCIEQLFLFHKDHGGSTSSIPSGTETVVECIPCVQMCVSVLHSQVPCVHFIGRL